VDQGFEHGPIALSPKTATHEPRTFRQRSSPTVCATARERIVIFSGGPAKKIENVIDECARSTRAGASVDPRTQAFQRPRAERIDAEPKLPEKSPRCGA
jgi:hypothetical protein